MCRYVGNAMVHVMNETVERQLLWRYATKRFDSTKDISERNWETLEQALLQAPSSFGLQPWRVISIRDGELREKLRAVSWNQSQVVESSHFVVLAAKASVEESDVDKAMHRICEVRELAPENLSSYRGLILSFLDGLKARGALEAWCTHQAYLALGVLLSTSAMLQIDACPLEGIDANAYDELLGLESAGLRTKVACALGYRSEQDLSAQFKKVRISREELFLRR
jgi:nitroreductase